MREFSHFGVVGAGAWGTALAQSLHLAGRSVTLWAYEPDVARAINTRHENTVFLPDVPLAPEVLASTAFADLAACDALLLVCPAQHLRAIAAQLADQIRRPVPLVICAKGIEERSLRLMSQVLRETLPPHPVMVLSGPTFAAEVARGKPAAVTLACTDRRLADQMAQAIGHPLLRPYVSGDVIGAQVGGAVKNVLAIACGIAAGREMGANASAALITRGLSEIMRLGRALGGQSETFMGLSGLGDLVLTCSSSQSRNMSLGTALGAGQTLREILAQRKSVSEGVSTAAALFHLALREKTDMPICMAVYRILHEGSDVGLEIEGLLNRPFTTESG